MIAPAPLVTQTPATEKHPAVRSIPLANVDVAVNPVMFRYDAWTPAPKVEVATPDIVVVAVVPIYREL